MGMGLVVHVGILFKNTLKKRFERRSRGSYAGTPCNALSIGIDHKTGPGKTVAEDTVCRFFANPVYPKKSGPERGSRDVCHQINAHHRYQITNAARALSRRAFIR